MNILIIENVWMGNAKYGFFDKTVLTITRGFHYSPNVVCPSNSSHYSKKTFCQCDK